MNQETKYDGDERGFSQLSKTWYGKTNLTNPAMLDIISIGFYTPDGGTSGEFQVAWEKLAGKWIPRLKAFDDSWISLSNFSDMLKAMAGVDDQNIPPDDFASMLEKLGIRDMTRVTQ
ncbi:MAG: hypothetical protein PF495_10065 [Spirochaetales bacterium]|jgi:hypothetical protein|nr:hypothetical protein [Spirochaetales bacterium]